eukprot:Gb_24925 [translate_table: standard]
MATSGASKTGFKKSPDEGSWKSSQGVEPGILKQSSVIGSSQIIEAGTIDNKQSRGVDISSASDTDTLRQTVEVESISQTVEADVWKQKSEVFASEQLTCKQGSSVVGSSQTSGVHISGTHALKQALRGAAFSQSSELHTEETATLKQSLRKACSSQATEAHISDVPTLKQALRGVDSSQTSGEHTLEVPTLKQALREVGLSHVSEAGTSETLTLKQALRGVSISPSSKIITSRQLSRGPVETDTSKQPLKVAATSQTLETGIAKQLPKGSSTLQKLGVGNLENSWKGECSSNTSEASLWKEPSVSDTSTTSATGKSLASEGVCQLLEARPSSSSEAGPSQHNKWAYEPEKECIWDASLPPSGSLSPHSSVDGSGVVTGASSVKNSTSANISDAIISDEKSSLAKNSESAKASGKGDSVESAKSSVSRGSNSSGVSDDSTWSNLTGSGNKPHKANDPRWEAILAVRMRDGILGLSHFRLLKRLGCGDIGSVYLSELSGTRCYFAMKVMDKGSLASRKKLLRAQTEREILQSLDHPFLPTLYTHFETDKFSCLVMEFCPGGDLHTLRQRQPGKHFSELAARFYAAEVLLALEYLHMLGVVYRDLKPENVLVREDGHIMLSDFDLSLRCAVSPTLVKSSSVDLDPSKRIPAYCVQPACIEPSCVQPVCVQPSCVQPSCFVPRFFPQRSKKVRKPKNEVGNQVTPLPELIAEPTSARSMSFVGTHEYLAPEIIKGEGHGSAVDWWTFGIFLHELLFGKTPFKGSGNRATLFNVVGQPLRFPESPTASFAARDLIRGLLVKEPQHRLAVKRGATEIKQHPFFEGVNWALIRCTTPPDIPKPFETDLPGKAVPTASTSEKKIADADSNSAGNYLDFDFF